MTYSNRLWRVLLYFAFAKALLIASSCQSTNLSSSKVSAALIPVDSTALPVNEIENFIAPYRDNVDLQMDKPLSYTSIAMHKNDYKLNTPISNMMAQIVYDQGNKSLDEDNLIDLVLLNHGGIRASIDAGEISTRTAYEVMPFENEIVIATLNHNQITEMINYLAAENKAHPIYGLKLIVDNGAMVNALYKGKELDTTATYRVATSDYLYNGGDRMRFFKNTPVEKTNYKIRNAMIDYFKLNDTISFKRDHRFIYANELKSQ